MQEGTDLDSPHNHGGNAQLDEQFSADLNLPMSPTAATASGGGIGTDMMSVARRIRDRALALEEARRKVEETEPIILRLNHQRVKEQATNDKLRRVLLQKTNERNAVELEILDVREAIAAHKVTTSELEKATHASEERFRELVVKRTHSAETFYGPQLARMETYSKVLESVVKSREAAAEARRLRLECLRTKLQKSKAREKEILKETKDVEEAIDLVKEEANGGGCGDDNDAEVDKAASGDTSDGVGQGNKGSAVGQVDEEITALSKRVREAIEKRSALRKKLKAVQKKYNRANEKMLSWEGIAIENMTSGKR